MKTFTLNELRTNYRLLKSIDIVELPSGTFALESRQPVTSDTFATREEAEALLLAEIPNPEWTDLKVEERTPSEPVYDKDGLLTLKQVGPQRFVVTGYTVSHLDKEFTTVEEADEVLSQVAQSFAEALAHEIKNKSALPVVEVINTDGGQITVREGPMIGRWYTFTDSDGKAQGSANSLSMLSCCVDVTRGLPLWE